MTRKEKLLEKVRNNPKNVPFEDLDKLVRWVAFILRTQKSGTSHFVYTKPGCPAPLTIPKKNPVNEAYVKLALRFIDDYGDLQD